jgi:hypothetical protein
MPRQVSLFGHFLVFYSIFGVGAASDAPTPGGSKKQDLPYERFINAYVGIFCEV